MIKIPVAALYPIALLAEIWAAITGKRPRFHRGLARLAHLRFIYTCDKARRELDYNPKPLEQTLANILGKLNLRG
jgi:dihydroflavonol-4-reductase